MPRNVGYTAFKSQSFNRIVSGKDAMRVANLAAQTNISPGADRRLRRYRLSHVVPTGDLIQKRLLDIVLATIGIFLLLPILLLLALAIKLSSPGPVFFRQYREGYLGRPFLLLKFRSMRRDGIEPISTRDDDTRITAIGRFMRKHSVDELPQLFNVLVGDMSLVGPRPHVPDMHAAGMPYRQIAPRYGERLLVLPGLTGLAQVNGLRGPIADQASALARIEHDLSYIRDRSLALDLRIIIRSVWLELSRGTGT